MNSKIVITLTLLSLCGCGGQCYIHAAQYLSGQNQSYVSGKPMFGSVVKELENRIPVDRRYRVCHDVQRSTVAFWLSQKYLVVGVYPVGFGLYHAVPVVDVEYDERIFEWYVSF